MTAERRALAPTRIHTVGHERVREAHSAETAEDYVEAIADLIEANGEARVGMLAERFGVSHVTVSRTVARLQKAGLARSEPYRPIMLTPRGRRMAAEAKQRHQIVLELLLALGVDEKTARADAEGIEHHVSTRTLKAVKRFLASRA